MEKYALYRTVTFPMTLPTSPTKCYCTTLGDFSTARLYNQQ